MNFGIKVLQRGLKDVVFENSSTENLLDNSTDTTTTSNIIDQGTLSQLVPIITLSTTFYVSVVIAGARHMKVEEREGNVLNLTGRFADLINRIKYHIDILKPWENKMITIG